MTSPVLDAAASPALSAVVEGDANPSGTSVSALLIDGTITDTDGAVEALAIEAVDTSLGTWQYSLDNGVQWRTVHTDLINSTTDGLALLLGPSALIRLVPFGDLNGTLAQAITFRAWDMGSGAAGQYVVTTPGIGGFSATSDTASIVVTAADDAPSFLSRIPGGGFALGRSADFNNEVASVALLPDGKILLAGYTNDTFTSRTFVARFDSDGRLDTGFGDSGVVLLPPQFDNQTLHVESMLLRTDGGIFLVGWGSGESGTFFSSPSLSLALLRTDGSFDPTFNGTGHLKVFAPPGFELNSSRPIVAVEQADGRLLVGGTAINPAGFERSMILFRINSDGRLDTQFNGTGVRLLSIGGSDDEVNAIAIQPDGKILVAGVALNSAPFRWDFGLARLNADGSLDTTFNGTGQLTLDGVGVPGALALLPDGKILAAGTVDEAFSVIRMNADGSLDTTFNGTGKIELSTGRFSFPNANDIIVQPDGKVVVSGESNSDATLLRLNADGTLDPTFDGDGMVRMPSTYIPRNSDEARAALARQPDGRLLLAVETLYSGAGVLRFLPDGSVDTGFATPLASTLGGSITYVEGTAAVAMDLDVLVHDPDLDTLQGGAGDYGGTSLTLMRVGGPHSQDVFGAVGSGTMSPLVGGMALVVGGVPVGLVRANTGGMLTLDFTPGATHAQLVSVLRQIAYSNTAQSRVGDIEVVWSFQDGNQGAQGPGGEMAALGSVTVHVIQAPQARVGTDGADTLTGGSGNDHIDGVGGVDTVVFTGARSLYTILWHVGTQGWTVQSEADGSDTLANVETLRFADLTVDASDFIDMTTPFVVASDPVDEAGAVPAASSIVVTFNEPIARGSGTVVLSRAGVVAETFDVVTSTQVVISGNSLAIVPSVHMVLGSAYSLVIPANAVEDLSGNPYAGLSGYNFSVQDVVAPTVGFIDDTEGIATGDIQFKLVFSETTHGTHYRPSGLYGYYEFEASDFVLTNGTIVDSLGFWRVSPTPGAEGQLTLTLLADKASDASGNLNIETSVSHAFDLRNPTVTAFGPADDAAGVLVNSDLAVTFSEPIARGVGAIALKTLAGTTVEVFNAASSNRLSFSGSTLTIDPTATLSFGKGYVLDIAAGSVIDRVGHTYAGISSFNFTTTLVDPADPKTAYLEIAHKFYLAYFGRAADTGGLNSMAQQFADSHAPTTLLPFMDSYSTNATVHAIIDSFGLSAESQALYGSTSTAARVSAVYGFLFNRAPDTEGLNFWAGAIDSGGLSLAQAALRIMQGAENHPLEDGLTIVKKVIVAQNFTSALDTPTEANAYAGNAAAATVRTMLGGVSGQTDTAAYEPSVLEAIARLVAAHPAAAVGFQYLDFTAAADPRSDAETMNVALVGVDGYLTA